MALSRVTPTGWLEESGSLSRVTPFGWLQESQSGGGTTDATATTSLPSLTLSAPTATATGTGGAQNGSATATFAAIALSAPTATASGTSASAGTITTPVLKNNTGTVLASQTGITAHIYAVSSGDKVVTLTGQTTNGSGIMTLSDALIIAGTQYRVVIVLGSGAEGMEKLTAS